MPPRGASLDAEEPDLSDAKIERLVLEKEETK
jgi:hypothetical protein